MADTIFAVGSGSTPSAIAIIRMSGPGSRLAIERFCRVSPEPRRAAVTTFHDPDSGSLIDRGLLLWFSAPFSFTGEDCVEFHLHGGRAVVRAILRALSNLPEFRPAIAGEFMRRAFVNGKVDLTEAEGLADVIGAETEMQLQQALAIGGGGLSRWVKKWRDGLTEALALVAASIDFSDESDVPSSWEPRVRVLVNSIHFEMSEILEGARRGEIVREGYCVVISGPPNVGKSSLLNAIAGRDVAIVSTVAGTTRDLIEVRLDINGIPVTIIDTAGLREASDAIESEGVRRAIRKAEEAHLVLWVYDLKAPVPVFPELQAQSSIIYVGNKSDCFDGQAQVGLPVSAVSGAGIRELLDAIELRAREMIEIGSPALISHERHRAELFLATVALADVEIHMGAPELVAEDLRLACRRLESLIGVVNVETVLGEVFSRFCIGK